MTKELNEIGKKFKRGDLVKYNGCDKDKISSDYLSIGYLLPLKDETYTVRSSYMADENGGYQHIRLRKYKIRSLKQKIEKKDIVLFISL